MKLFNIDMHISIIHDVKNIFKNMGHEIDSVCMSGHTWVNKEKQGNMEIINTNNWGQINQEMCDRFYERYKTELDKYDAFIHSYPPAFALLFEKWNKPVITIACTRFEYPCSDRFEWLKTGLMRMINNKQLIPIANNLFDKRYCEEFLGGEWKHISSLCDYMVNKWSPNDNQLVTWSRSNIMLVHNKINHGFSIYHPYDRETICNYKGIIHIPYNISIMSAFEQYYTNIPMFVPTVECIENWARYGRVILSELYFKGSFPVKKDWVHLADWYDDNNMPYTIKYSSEDDLYNKINTINYNNVSQNMLEFNKVRKDRIYKQWEDIIKAI